MIDNIIAFSNTEFGGLVMGLTGIPIIMAPVYLFDDKKARLISGVILGLAAGAYINSGLGPLELPLSLLMLFLAYLGTSSWKYVGLGWLTHAGLDLVHHNIGTPLFSYYEMSSLGCFSLDVIIGIWFLLGEKYLPKKKSITIQPAL